MYTDIKTGFSCNNKCIHCVIAPLKVRLKNEQRRIDSSTKQVFKYIDDAVKRGSDTVVLTGGEITIRKDFKDIVLYAKNKKLNIVIQTNGRRISEMDDFSFLKYDKKITFVIAIHGNSRYVHDAITRVPGSFSETTDAIGRLNKLPNANIIGKLVISRINYKKIFSTLSLLFNKYQIHDFTIAFPHAEDFSAKDIRTVVPRYNSIRNQIGKILNWSAENSIRVVYETIPFCILGDRPDFWSHTLDSKFAIEDESKKKAFIQISGDSKPKEWESLRKSIKKRLASCNKCLLEKLCEGPWYEYIENYGKEEFIPITNLSLINNI
jgi:MoaA/NifB/PqqE/SkfB family radical SAM enzyme